MAKSKSVQNIERLSNVLLDSFANLVPEHVDISRRR